MPPAPAPAPDAQSAKDSPAVIEKQLERIETGHYRFEPDTGLPVWIDYRKPKDPFELSETVKYENGPLKVIMPRGFKCDASSTPWMVWFAPAIPQLLIALLWYLNWTPNALMVCWALGLILSVLLPWITPGVGQLGIHARAVFIHDALYRTQETSRIVADATCMEVMEYDRVPLLTRWMIYIPIRIFGAYNWRKNAAIIAAKKAAEEAGSRVSAVADSQSPEPISVLAPCDEKKTPTT